MRRLVRPRTLVLSALFIGALLWILWPAGGGAEATCRLPDGRTARLERISYGKHHRLVRGNILQRKLGLLLSPEFCRK